MITQGHRVLVMSVLLMTFCHSVPIFKSSFSDCVVYIRKWIHYMYCSSIKSLGKCSMGMKCEVWHSWIKISQNCWVLMSPSPESPGELEVWVLFCPPCVSSPLLQSLLCSAQLQHGGGLARARGRGQSILQPDQWLPPLWPPQQHHSPSGALQSANF